MYVEKFLHGIPDVTVSVNAGFWQESCVAGFKVPFQLTIRGGDITQLAFKSLSIAFSDGRPDIVIDHGDDAGSVVDVGRLESDPAQSTHHASLRWNDGKQLLVCGSWTGDKAGLVAVCLCSLLTC